MLSWANDPCTLQVQVFPNGDVAVVDRKNTIGFLKVNAGNKFKVLWGDAPVGEANQFPEYSQNCTQGCTPTAEWGGTCVCDLTVVDEPVVILDTAAATATAAQVLPTESELREMLKNGAVDPALYSNTGTTPDLGYTLCTTEMCTSRPEIRVHTRGTSQNPTSFDAIFEFVNSDRSERPSERNPNKFLLNRVRDTIPPAFRSLEDTPMGQCRGFCNGSRATPLISVPLSLSLSLSLALFRQ